MPYVFNGIQELENLHKQILVQLFIPATTQGQIDVQVVGVGVVEVAGEVGARHGSVPGEAVDHGPEVDLADVLGSCAMDQRR